MKPKTRKKRGCRYWFNLLLVGFLGALFLCHPAYIALWVQVMAGPARAPACCTTPADLGFDYEEVAISSEDGVRLAGWYIPSRNRAVVILLHGYGANRMEMLARAQILAGQGYGVLLYDQRASGESEGETRSFGWADVQDVQAVLGFLQKRPDVDAERIGILGFSLGGQITLRAAAETSEIKAVVAEEPGHATIEDIPPLPSLYDRWVTFTYWLGFKALEWRTGVRPQRGVIDGIAVISPRPVLFIVTGPHDDPGHRMVEYFYEHAREPKTLWQVPEAGHGDVPQVRPEEYEERILSFFDEALLVDK